MATGFSSGNFQKISSGLYQVNFDLGFSSSHLATGLEKLAFEVLYNLFTTQGSIPGSPDVGCYLQVFVGSLTMGKDETVVVSAITGEVMKVENSIRVSQLQASIPAEEMLKTIILDSIDINTG